MASTSEQPRTYPESVPVTCGGLRATLLVDKGRILHSGGLFLLKAAPATYEVVEKVEIKNGMWVVYRFLVTEGLCRHGNVPNRV